MHVLMTRLACEVAHTARRLIKHEAQKRCSDWLWNLVVERFLDSLLDLISSDAKVTQLLEGFGTNEWPYIVQGMFPNVPMLVALPARDDLYGIEVDSNGLVTKCGAPELEGRLFVGDHVTSVNGMPLRGRSLARVVSLVRASWRDYSEVTLELRERPIEQAVLAMSRASVADLRRLTTYLRGDRDHPALRVKQDVFERRELSMKLLESPDALQFLARRIASSHVEALKAKRYRHNAIKGIRMRIVQVTNLPIVSSSRVSLRRASNSAQGATHGDSVQTASVISRGGTTVSRDAVHRSVGSSEATAAAAATAASHSVARVQSRRMPRRVVGVGHQKA